MVSSGRGVVMRGLSRARVGALGVAAIGLLVVAGGAKAADLAGALPTKAPPPAVQAYDWSGFYLGGHVGYAFGNSNFGDEAGADPRGSLNFSNAYNFSTGDGSYLLGLQAGYDYMAASRWLVGVVADVSVPSFCRRHHDLFVAAGWHSELSRPGRIFRKLARPRRLCAELGAGNWLFYATGGLAISYDQFTRTQLAGVPVGGTAVPGTIENAFLTPRAGGAVGAGVEFAFAAHWTAQFEYLFTDYGRRSVMFPAGAQRFDSDLTLANCAPV